METTATVFPQPATFLDLQIFQSRPVAAAVPPPRAWLREPQLWKLKLFPSSHLTLCPLLNNFILGLALPESLPLASLLISTAGSFFPTAGWDLLPLGQEGAL